MTDKNATLIIKDGFYFYICNKYPLCVVIATDIQYINN